MTPRTIPLTLAAVLLATPGAAEIPDALQAEGGGLAGYDTDPWAAPGLVADAAATPEQLRNWERIAREGTAMHLRSMDQHLARLENSLDVAITRAEAAGADLRNSAGAVATLRAALERTRTLRRDAAAVDIDNLSLADADRIVLDIEAFGTQRGHLASEVRAAIEATRWGTGFNETAGTVQRDLAIEPTLDEEPGADNRGSSVTNAFAGSILAAKRDVDALLRFGFDTGPNGPGNAIRRYLQARGAAGNLTCQSPCSIPAEGLGLASYISEAAYHFAGRSPGAAAFFTPTGYAGDFPSQFDHIEFYETQGGTQFDWRSHFQGSGVPPTFQNDWTSWYHRFHGPTGISSGGVEGIFAGFWGSYMSELVGMDMAALLDEGGRRIASDELTAALQTRFPNLDPAVADAVANGTVIRIAQAIAGGTLSGTGSTGGFSDLTLQLPLLFEVFDFGAVDGDIITLQVTDSNGVQLGPLTLTMSGPASADRFAPDVVAGPIEITVTAENTGAFFPNTGEVRILSAIIEGDPGQRFSLTTGESGVLSITAAPPPAPATAAAE